MTDLLVITDVPRLGKVFSRLADDHSFRLRLTSSLEKGGEELVADKPAMVFVQTHLSGLAADILLLHLKKLLGRRRTRFVLLSPPDQVGEEILKLYQGHVDSSLADQPLAEAILGVITDLAPGKKKGAAAKPAGAALPEGTPLPAGEPVRGEEPSPAIPGEGDPLQRELSVPAVAPPPEVPLEEAPEPTLEEQGVVYAPRLPVQVYSEFTSSFDSAVSSMAAPEVPEVPEETPPIQATAGMFAQAQVDAEKAGRARPRSKLFSFLLWLVPVVVIVVVVTILQYRSIQPTSVDVAAAPATQPPPQAGVSVVPKKPAPIAAAPASKPVPKVPAGEPDGRMSDRAVLSAIEENRAVKAPAPAVPAANRPAALPAFIPRAGLDKAYGAANPGWERYKGVVTEFKVFREAGSIKAIQIIDRGGQGVPEAFMKAALQQVTRSPSYAVSSSEKKDGYEIQRGMAAQNLKAVYYRDAEGGRLRAFVLTWQ